MNARVQRESYDTLQAGERLRPLRNGIVVQVLPLPLSDRIIADWRGNAVYGRVLAVGPGHYPNIHRSGERDGKAFRSISSSARFRPTQVKVGDLVHLGGMDIGGYLFSKIYIDHAECVLATEDDICGIET